MPTLEPNTVILLSPVDDYHQDGTRQSTGLRRIAILGCINEHDGSGFIHAMLHACHPAYAQISSPYYRTHLAKSVRIGALPSVLRILREEGIGRADEMLIFNTAIAYGSPLPIKLLRPYAEYLGVRYRLYNAALELIEESEAVNTDREAKKQSSSSYCNIIMTADDEYHLLVRTVPSVRGDKPGSVRFRALNSNLTDDLADRGS